MSRIKGLKQIYNNDFYYYKNVDCQYWHDETIAAISMMKQLPVLA